MQVLKFLFQRWFVYFLGFCIRMSLLVYGIWQDNTMIVKYTDIDYKVLSDGARHVVDGNSPFSRATYRYTPLLAFLLIPNHIFTPLWGKFLFVVSDLLTAYLIECILSLQLKQHNFQNSSSTSTPQISFISSQKQNEEFLLILKYVCFWLFNPISINVSTRGNAESVIAFLVVLSIFLLLKKRIFWGSLIYGLAVHFKVYPILYSLPLFFWIAHNAEISRNNNNNNNNNNNKNRSSSYSLWRHFTWFFTSQSVFFALISASVFFLLTGAVYWMYGWKGLYEAYLYHLFRKDNRHNFSVYFYYIYLSTASTSTPTSGLSGSPISTSLTDLISSLISFVPQLCLFLAITWKYYKHITFCIFLQTLVFVVFNKVCTVQYFVWYFSLLPLALPYIKPSSPLCVVLLSLLWFGLQGLWLYFGYRLEFLGENKFFELWLASIGFFLVNILIIIQIIRWFHPLLPSKQKTQ